MKILIVGAGIGGLTAALSLHKAGFEVEVYEATSEIQALGVGINLLPHAVRVLTNLGLLKKLQNLAVETSELCYFNKFGQKIWREPRGKFAGYKWPQLSIHRGKLQMVLLEAAKAQLGKNNVHTGHQLTNCENNSGKVSATFLRKNENLLIRSFYSDILIGADGIHSAVRKLFYPDEGPPKFSGVILHRGTSLAKPFLSGSSMIMAGNASQKFVAYPISPNLDKNGNQLINWIADLKVTNGQMATRDWNRKADKEKLLAAFKDWKFDWIDAPALIRDAEAIYEFPMSDHDPLPQWSFDRITLLGDAAHPMYPIGSNGASQAILDAEVLTNSLSQISDPAKALQYYDEIRRPVTARVVLQNREMGPEQVMQIVEDRAPNGFENLQDVISKDELEEVSARYKKLAGFDKDELNQKI